MKAQWRQLIKPSHGAADGAEYILWCLSPTGTGVGH